MAGRSVTRQSYTAEEVDTALLTLAMTRGNSGDASRRLKTQGIVISDRLLRQWREHTHAARYVELATTRGRELEDAAVVRLRERILQADEVEDLALEKTREKLEADELKDPSAAARNVAVVKGIAIDHLLVMTGRPTEIVAEHRNVMDDLRDLARMVGISYDSTAEDITSERPAP